MIKIIVKAHVFIVLNVLIALAMVYFGYHMLNGENLTSNIPLFLTSLSTTLCCWLKINQSVQELDAATKQRKIDKFDAENYYQWAEYAQIPQNQNNYLN